MTALIDSDILIEVLRGRDPRILARWMELGASEDFILCSPVSVAELWHGVRPKEYQVLSAMFDALICVPIDAEIGQLAGEYLRAYHRSHSLELGDALIAATARQQNAALWTRNRKHYPMPGMQFH